MTHSCPVESLVPVADSCRVADSAFGVDSPVAGQSKNKNFHHGARLRPREVLRCLIAPRTISFIGNFNASCLRPIVCCCCALCGTLASPMLHVQHIHALTLAQEPLTHQNCNACKVPHVVTSNLRPKVLWLMARSPAREQAQSAQRFRGLGSCAVAQDSLDQVKEGSLAAAPMPLQSGSRSRIPKPFVPQTFSYCLLASRYGLRECWRSRQTRLTACLATNRRASL